MLNPDRDLNGASRRALTIAFILALTDVSEVEAPNTIDYAPWHDERFCQAFGSSYCHRPVITTDSLSYP